ncbi:MAG: SNF2-related protein, partial [Spirochaetota bacterium]
MEQLSFDFNRIVNTQIWPSQYRFPLNIKHAEGERTVEALIHADYEKADDYLIITGFTSLDYLVRFFGSLPPNKMAVIRIVFGNEPEPSLKRHPSLRALAFSEEIREYWLERGISILLNGPLINFLSKITEEKIHFFASENLHAKIYISNNHAIMGSSNFSFGGLRNLSEANIRFPAAQKRYDEIKEIAENFLSNSQNCTEKIQHLLEDLLKEVSWKETLSRAVAELLEGGWITRYPFLFSDEDGQTLWPSQKQAIAQALWILDNQGSVLIADPTGSGKTRVGLNLLYSLINRKWRTQAGSIPNAVVISPPLIQESCWKGELNKRVRAYIDLVSSGVLSAKDSLEHEQALENIKNAGILLIDESHNFLNSRSARSQTIAYNSADHVILSTATPINRKITDLLRLIEILGVDNLSKEIILIYNRFRYKRSFNEEEMGLLRDYIQKITVRRTKKELNRMIDREPDAYINRLGKPCRYPLHICRTYSTGETAEDIATARKIDKIALNLRGLLFLRNINIYFNSVKDKEDHSKMLERSLSAAKALAVYNVRSMLRSSRAALIEHIHGTGAALKFTGITGIRPHGEKSGNVVKTLKENSESLPNITLSAPLPDWLINLPRYREECEKEIDAYKKIADLATKMSEAREKSKIVKIAEIAGHHSLVLVYDNRIITLYYMNHLLKKHYAPAETFVVTGTSPKKLKRQISHIFDLESVHTNKIAFCSDAMAEGVNFQAASSVVFLDLPSVIRLAEQRVGRVDRLDSPHKQIEVYWPDDGEAFSLRTDRRFVERHYMVKKILGSNMPIPEEFLKGYKEEKIGAEDMIRLYQGQQLTELSWDGIEDAFKPVRELISGTNGILSVKEYNLIKKIKSSVRSMVSCVQSDSPWGFFALRGSETRAPQWVFVDKDFSIEKDLSVICRNLRQRLTRSTDRGWHEEAHRFLKQAIKTIQRHEISMLPNKKQRAIRQMKEILKHYLKVEAVKNNYSARHSIIINLLSVLQDEDNTYDLYQLAQKWLELLKPYFIKAQNESLKKTVLRLKQLTPYLAQAQIATDKLKALLDSVIVLNPV